MARLSGWKRIGIILSVVWILGAGIYIYNAAMDHLLWDLEKQREKKVGLIQMEMRQKFAEGTPLTPDDLEKQKELKGEFGEGPPILLTPDELMQIPYYLLTPRKTALTVSTIFTFVSLALGWGFVYLILFLVAWVKRGFTSPGNSN